MQLLCYFDNLGSPAGILGWKFFLWNAWWYIQAVPLNQRTGSSAALGPREKVHCCTSDPKIAAWRPFRFRVLQTCRTSLNSNRNHLSVFEILLWTSRFMHLLYISSIEHAIYHAAEANLQNISPNSHLHDCKTPWLHLCHFHAFPIDCPLFEIRCIRFWAFSEIWDSSNTFQIQDLASYHIFFLPYWFEWAWNSSAPDPISHSNQRGCHWYFWDSQCET